jgi:hypothetical protein
VKHKITKLCSSRNEGLNIENIIPHQQIWSWIVYIHIPSSQPIPLMSILILHSHLHFSIPNGVFNQISPPKFCTHPMFPILATCQTHHILWMENLFLHCWNLLCIKNILQIRINECHGQVVSNPDSYSGGLQRPNGRKGETCVFIFCLLSIDPIFVEIPDQVLCTVEILKHFLLTIYMARCMRWECVWHAWIFWIKRYDHDIRF